MFGNTEDVAEAIAEAFKMAKGFFPVRLVCPWFPSIFVAPLLVFSLRLPADLTASP